MLVSEVKLHDPAVLVNFNHSAWYLARDSFERNEARAYVSKEADFPYMYLRAQIVYLRRRHGFWERGYKGENSVTAYWQVSGPTCGGPLNKLALL